MYSWIGTSFLIQLNIGEHVQLDWYQPEKLVWPKMTFNDLEGQNYIAYSAIKPNKSMHTEYQVNLKKQSNHPRILKFK